MHGEFEQNANDHFVQKCGCSKCGQNRTAISHKHTQEYFIKKANIVHNNKYTYFYTNYTFNRKTIIITCPIHGEFVQKANGHLQGKGCKKCANDYTSIKNKENPTGWSPKNWEIAGNKSKNKNFFKVYIIRCWNDFENFYKIGKTFNTVKYRFSGKRSMPYKYEIVKIIKGSAIEISKLKKELQKDHKEFQYKPLISFKGQYECFTQINLL